MSSSKLLKTELNESKKESEMVESKNDVENVQIKKHEKSIVVVWDFDWSLINENSDYYLYTYYFKEEGLNIFSQLRQNAAKNNITIFTEFMNDVAWQYLFQKSNINKDQFVQSLSTIPVFDENLHIVKTIHNNRNHKNEDKYEKQKYHQFIISNANTELIDIILNHNKLTDIFKKEHIFTNKGWFDEETEILRCEGYINKNTESHGCVNSHCAVNICKGNIFLSEIISKQFDNSWDNIETIIYIGDGAADLCPITKLRSCDYAFIRKDFELDKTLNSQLVQDSIQTKNIFKWKNGEELLQCFQNCLKEIDFDTVMTTMPFMNDCNSNNNKTNNNHHNVDNNKTTGKIYI